MSCAGSEKKVKLSCVHSQYQKYLICQAKAKGSNHTWSHNRPESFSTLYLQFTNTYTSNELIRMFIFSVFCDFQLVLTLVLLYRNSSWGLRDIDDVKKLAEQNGLKLEKLVRIVMQLTVSVCTLALLGFLFHKGRCSFKNEFLMLNLFSLGYSVFIMNNCYCCTLTKGQPHTHSVFLLLKYAANSVWGWWSGGTLLNYSSGL